MPNQISQHTIRQIQWLFQQLQKNFDIYNDTEVYASQHRFEAYDTAMKYAERLKPYGLYYIIHDEDDDNSFIRPDAYNEKYNGTIQKRIEKLANITYETGEE